MGQAASHQANHTTNPSERSRPRTADLPIDERGDSHNASSRPASASNRIPLPVDHPHADRSASEQDAFASTVRPETASYQPDDSMRLSRPESMAQTTSSSTSGRLSTMSRLGTRLLSNHTGHSLPNSGDEVPTEGRAHRDGLLSRTLRRTRNPPGISPSRITRRRLSRTMPYPLLPDSDPGLLESSLVDRPPLERSSSMRQSRNPRRSRFSHVRHSIAAPLSQLFGQQTPASDPASMPSLLSPTSDLDMDLDEPPSTSPPPGPAPEDGSRTFPDVHPSPPGLIRPSAGPLLGREEPTPLSRVLQLAAAAIASQLSGNPSAPTPPIPPIRQPPGDGNNDDRNNDGNPHVNSFDAFIQTLQRAASAQAEANHGEASNIQPPAQNGGTPPNVNFLRVFRFNADEGNRENGDRDNNGTAERVPGSVSGDGTEHDGNQPNTDGARTAEIGPDSPHEQRADRRLVTLVVVGVRSIPTARSPPPENGGGLRSNLGSLFRMPMSQGSLFRDRDQPSHERSSRYSRSRFNPRRQSMMESGSGGSSFHPVHRPPTPRPYDDLIDPVDADEPLSPMMSPRATDTATTNLAGAHTASPPFPDMSASTGRSEFGDSDLGNVRQRRRSDSETARHRGLGSGAARRNGVVEPDGGAPTAGRSWLIYVVGTNLAENHPALATPSLFTDVSCSECSPALSSMLTLAEPHLRRYGSPIYSTGPGQASRCFRR